MREGGGLAGGPVDPGGSQGLEGRRRCGTMQEEQLVPNSVGEAFLVEVTADWGLEG